MQTCQRCDVKVVNNQILCEKCYHEKISRKMFIVKSAQSPALKVDRIFNTTSLNAGWWRIDCKPEDEAIVREAMKKYGIEILSSC